MVAQTGQWWVGVSTGSGFTTSLWTVWSPSAGWTNFLVGDFTGDGFNDFAARDAAGEWWVAASTGANFVNDRWSTWNSAAGWPDVFSGRLT
jgi:hypothetical protein